MDSRIHRITPSNTAILLQVDPDVFDSDIDPDRLAAFAREPLHLLAVALSGQRVVGQNRAIVHKQPDGPDQLYLDNLGVANSHLRQGIATALMREAFAWGQEKGCAEAWVATEPENLAARALYTQLTIEQEQAVWYFPLNIHALDAPPG